MNTKAFIFALLGFSLACTVSGCVTASASDKPPVIETPSLASRLDVAESAPQGGLLIGQTDPGCTIRLMGDAAPVDLRVSTSGRFVFGIGRDETADKTLRAECTGRAPTQRSLRITRRVFDIEQVDGVPPATVNPPPAIAERIAKEQAEVNAARTRDDAREDFAQTFRWPAQGRISGVYGSQRIYNGTPKSWHSGLDIAAPTGTPVLAPAAGVVSFVGPDLYLTGGTVLIDHGHGVSSNFLHLSRIDVKLGDRIEAGQRIGAIGATGRATGPHLHWGMNWFGVRVDPRLLLSDPP